MSNLVFLLPCTISLTIICNALLIWSKNYLLDCFIIYLYGQSIIALHYFIQLPTPTNTPTNTVDLEAIRQEVRAISDSNISMKQHITDLLGFEVQALKSLGEKISGDANRLYNSLQGDIKSQGIWGEMLLDKTLEISGLRKGIEYETQVTLQLNGKTFRPDVFIELPTPNKTNVLIDAKTSMKHYLDYMDNRSDKSLKAYKSAIKDQIKLLSSKNYEDLTDSRAGITIMFIPIESALSCILQDDSELLELAYQNNVILTSPSTLLLGLKLIASIFRENSVIKNSKEISLVGAKVLDSSVLLLNDISDLDKLNKKSSDKIHSIIKNMNNKTGLYCLAKQLSDLGVSSKKKQSHLFDKL